jgi:hypothetical protein
MLSGGINSSDCMAFYIGRRGTRSAWLGAILLWRKALALGWSIWVSRTWQMKSKLSQVASDVVAGALTFGHNLRGSPALNTAANGFHPSSSPATSPGGKFSTRSTTLDSHARR